MNYYAARQRDEDKKWDYTCMNDGRTWPTGYCSKFLEAKHHTEGGYFHTQESIDKHNGFKDKYGPHNHGTKEEAMDCYKDYLLDNDLKFYPYKKSEEKNPAVRKEYRCQFGSCESYETGLANIDHRTYHLCDRHQTREAISSLFEVGEAWSSY